MISVKHNVWKPWLTQFSAQLLHDDGEAAVSDLVESTPHRKERVLARSKYAYARYLCPLKKYCMYRYFTHITEPLDI